MALAVRHAEGRTLIRPADPADAERLSAFAMRTFIEAFGPDNRAEDIARHVESRYAPGEVARDLADPARATLLVEHDDTIAAFAQLRDGPAPPSVGDGIELLRFYVDRPWHGRGLAVRLMHEVFDVARARGARAIWLGVWERNARAIAFYRKAGFRDVGSVSFLLGTDLQTDRLMLRSLDSDGE